MLGQASVMQHSTVQRIRSSAMHQQAGSYICLACFLHLHAGMVLRGVQTRHISAATPHMITAAAPSPAWITKHDAHESSRMMHVKAASKIHPGLTCMQA
jgi:hypothetical protein